MPGHGSPILHGCHDQPDIANIQPTNQHGGRFGSGNIRSARSLRPLFAPALCALTA